MPWQRGTFNILECLVNFLWSEKGASLSLFHTEVLLTRPIFLVCLELFFNKEFST
jgi:hypothetical protein